MSTDPIRNPVSESHPPTVGVGPGTIAYRIGVLLLLGICVWFLSQAAHGPQASALKPAYALPGNTWQHVYEFDKKQMTAQMEFRGDGTIVQRGSGQGKFLIHSLNEISIDPTSPTGGLFGWPQSGIKSNWSVDAVGDDLLLQRKSPPNDRVVLHKVREPDEPTKEILRALGGIRTDLQIQDSIRQSAIAAIQRELQLLREMEKKRLEDGKK